MNGRNKHMMSPKDMQRLAQQAARGSRVYPGESVSITEGAFGNAVSPADTHCLPGEVKAIKQPGVWVTATAYGPGSLVRNIADDNNYRCYLGHTAAALNQPDVGADWADFWVEVVSTYECYVYDAERTGNIYPRGDVWPVFIDDSVSGELVSPYRGLLSTSYTGDWFMYPYDKLAEAAVDRGTASGNHSFHAVLADTAQTIVDSTWTTVEFERDTPVASPNDDWLHDDDAAYDIVNFRYVCPTEGYYHLSSQLGLDPDAFWRARLQYSPDLGANWYDIAANLAEPADNVAWNSHLTLTCMAKLDVGDWVRVRVWQQNGGAANRLVDGSAIYSNFCGVMVYPVITAGVPVVALPKRATMWHDEATVIAGGALASAFPGGNQRYKTYSYQPGALNDEFTNGCFLRAGIYTFTLLCITIAAGGIITWYVDGVAIGTTDVRSAVTTYNVTKTIAAIAVTTDGWHKITGKVLGTSGAGHSAWLTKYWFKQAAD